jgi:hypothetical protein
MLESITFGMPHFVKRGLRRRRVGYSQAPVLFSMFDTKNPEAGFPGAPALSEVDNPIFRQDAPSRYDYALA